ncbi:MAG TPA: hypothetical protein PKY81_13450 [bacterium]|nr:hypothetical protein [bacterium]
MAFDYKVIKDITSISNEDGVIYANPADTKTFIRLIMLHNYSDETQNVKLYKTASGVGSTARKFYDEDLPANDTRQIEFAIPGLILSAENNTINAVAETADSVNIYIAGGEEQ